MKERYIDKRELESDPSTSDVENAERHFKQAEHTGKIDANKKFETTGYEQELKPYPSSEEVYKAEATYRGLERRSFQSASHTANPELNRTLAKYRSLGYEIEYEKLDTAAINKLMRYKGAEKVIDLSARSDLSSSGRAELINKNAKMIESWGGDKEWLVNNAELLEDLDDIDLSIFNPEQQKKFNDLSKHFDGRLDTGAIVSLATELDNPQDSAELLNDLTDKVYQAKNIDGIEDVVNDIARTNSVAEFRGSQFELEWISSNARNPEMPIRSVALLEVNQNRIGKSIDVQLADGRAVELKSYENYSGQGMIDGFEKQLELDVTRRGASGGVLVLDGRSGPINESTQRRLDIMIEDLKTRYPNKSFHWETYPR